MSEQTETALQQIIKAYRDELGNGQGPLPFRDFADQLSEGFHAPVPHQSVESWEKGRYSPSMAFLDSLANMTTDWRHDFASDLLAALYPMRFKPVGKIGKRILSGKVEQAAEHAAVIEQSPQAKRKA